MLCSPHILATLNDSSPPRSALHYRNTADSAVLILSPSSVLILACQCTSPQDTTDTLCHAFTEVYTICARAKPVFALAPLHIPDNSETRSACTDCLIIVSLYGDIAKILISKLIRVHSGGTMSRCATLVN